MWLAESCKIICDLFFFTIIFLVYKLGQAVMLIERMRVNIVFVRNVQNVHSQKYVTLSIFYINNTILIVIGPV